MSGGLRRPRGDVLSPEGRISILPAGAWLISEVRSHQDQRQEAKVKSEGKRTSSSSAGPGGRQEKRDKSNDAENITVLEIEENSRVWSMSSLLAVW